MARIQMIENRTLKTVDGEYIVVEHWNDIIVLKVQCYGNKLHAFDARFIANALNEYADKLDQQ